MLVIQAAEDLLTNQGRDALRKAQERSRKFGEESEKMSSIAREARTLAEQLVQYSIRIYYIKQI